MKINIQSLADGVHEFDFVARPDEIDVDNPILSNEIRVHVTLSKSESAIHIRGEVETPGSFVCDNCLAEFERRIRDDFTVLYTPDRETAENDDEEIVHLLEPGTLELNLTPSVRDAMLLALPLKAVCKENCRGLCGGCGADLNQEKCQCVHDDVDPRWNALRQLLEKKN